MNQSYELFCGIMFCYLVSYLPFLLSFLSVSVTAITVSYDTEENDPLLKVNHKLDDKNSVTPKISLKSGAASYGWTRALNGGSVETTYTPGDEAVVDVEWKDKGMGGVWTTKASIPVDDHSKTKLSISREFDY